RFDQLSLDRSFRSTPPVLALVDRLLHDLGPDTLGLVAPAPPHASARHDQPGSVTLWRAFAPPEVPDDAEEGWVDDATRAYATRLARQI
ncbi:hypothetical protein ACC848_40590, partial [Rhizobium johnstonii]